MWICVAPSHETSRVLRHGSHSFTCKLHHACHYLVSVHQMVPPLPCDNVGLIAAFYSSIDPERMKGCMVHKCTSSVYMSVDYIGL